MAFLLGIAAIAPLVLLVRRDRYLVNVPKALLVTITATLVGTSLALLVALSNVDDIGAFVAIFFFGAPLVAVPIAAVAATSIADVKGYGIAAALMAFAGWVIGIIVVLLLARSPEAHGTFTDLLVILAVPASYASTCAVYAAALGKRKV